jgi:Tfp pilus assembly protein PilV
MTRNLALAVSVTMLAAISGQAFAASAPHARHRMEAVESSQQVTDTFNAMDSMPATPAVAVNTHRYEGGPKTND